ncbi:DUF4348 domain-containing protein [Marinoscillum sp.]|uniref:DUF4348 domain-containing protein n=1 Tax=Marinoscillum sp. TaxID=2024838 RepID=UPI003BADB352
MKRTYLTCFILFLLVGCSKKLNTSRVDESFDEFYDQFHQDVDFQLSRVQFPLEGEYVDLDGEKPWRKEEWEPHVQKVTDISDPEYDTEIIRKETVVIDKVWLRDSGFSIERRFEKLDGKWYLVYYQTINL